MDYVLLIRTSIVWLWRSALEIASTGRVTSYRFHEVVFQSKQRLTYKQVQDSLDAVEADHQSPAALKAAIVDSDRFSTNAVAENLADLFSLYRGHVARVTEVLLDFDSVEPKFSFDDKGKISSVVPHQRLEAHRLIEECMLAANVAAARCLEKFKLPTLYRIHEGPSDERLMALRQFLGSMALGLGGGEKPEPSDYQVLLDQAQARPDFPLIQAMILRSMQQAK